jgi:hypothetical protein
MAGADRDVLPGLCLPRLGEGRVDGGIQLSRRVVADVEQRGLGAGGRRQGCRIAKNDETIKSLEINQL